MRLRTLAFLCCAALLTAGEDPFEAPPELQAFARQHTLIQMGVRAKLDYLVKAFFAPESEGGLGITYDNAYTRTPVEAWRDRKANCLTLTMLYVAACKQLDINARYGESLRVSRWRRMGTTVRYERHVVAVIQMGLVGQELVADFLPEVHQQSQMIALLSPERVRALFHSNRAVELLADNRSDEALQNARLAISVDPSTGVGWNILGVVQRSQGLDAEAEHAFLQALAKDPKDGAPYGNMENLLRAQGREDEAQSYRDRGMEARKKDPFFNAFLAEEAMQGGLWDEAQKRIKQAISLLPRESDFYLMQARVNLAQGQRKAAIKALENARKWALPDMQARYDTKLALLRGEIPA